MAAGNVIRGPGRPPAEQSGDVRSALIEAARTAIVEVGFTGASTKLIAAQAGVNPAMINYYFGSKAALGDAAFRNTIEPLSARLDELAAGSDGTKDIFAFLRDYMETLAAHPWIPRLIVREVLPENGRFRAIFFSEVVGRGVAILPRAIAAAQHDGRIDTTLDPRFVAVAMISLAAFPFLTAGILSSNLGIDFSDRHTFAAFAEHTHKLLCSGLSDCRGPT